MSRIEPAPPAETEVDRALEARILEARGKVSPLYRILLNSPEVADGWERLLTAIRQRTSLSPRSRELIILRVAVLNGAEYEFEAHVPHARKAGLSDAEIAALQSSNTALFDEHEQLVLEYTDTMTRSVSVPDALFDRIRAEFDPAGCVELTATIAAYNMVSRFLVALDVR